MKIPFTEATSDEEMDKMISQYHNSCIKLLFDPKDKSLNTTDLMVSFRKLDIIKDEISPTGVLPLSKYSYVYGIFIVGGMDNNNVSDKLLLRRVDLLPENQKPIHNEGTYRVGAEFQVSPGVWKSALLPTWSNSCYYERTSPLTGNIIDNHFGIGGLSIRLYEGEIFETNDDCTPWVFVGP